MDELKKDLRRWVKEKWGPDKGKPGDKTKSGKTPKWRPHKRVSSKTPQTWGEMSHKQKSKAKKLKSKAQKEKKQFSSHKTGKTWNVKKSEQYFNDILEKSFKSKLATAALGASLLTTSVSTEPKQKAYKEESVKLHPDLISISAIESNYGKNKKHRKVLHGVNLGHTAAGATGLMPLTVKDTVKKDKDLSERYPQTISMNHDDLTNFINKNPSIENKIANKHYNRLLKIFSNNKNRAAYAWRNGISAAKSKSDNEIVNDPYVKAVNSVKKAENYFENLKKAAAPNLRIVPQASSADKTPQNLLSPQEMAEKFKQDAEKLNVEQQKSIDFKQNEISKRFNLNKNQLKLISKIDFDNVEPPKSGLTREKKLKFGKTKNSFGENVFIKQNDPLGSFRMQDPKISLAQRELLYHDLANNVFKTGSYVPLTSLTNDGKNMYSVQKYLDNYSKEPFPERHVPSNTLQMLALQDAILGNGDRHTNNYLVKPADENGPANIMLIDNGFMMDYEQKNKFFTQNLDLYDENGSIVYKKGTKIPYDRFLDTGIEKMDLYDKEGKLYRQAGDLGRWMPAYLSKKESKSFLNEEVRNWLNSIDVNAAEQVFKKHGVSNETINKFKNRIKKAKKFANTARYKLGDILFKIDGMHKLARYRKTAMQIEKERKNPDLGPKGFLQTQVANKMELNKSHNNYFAQKLKKIDGATTTTMPPKPISQTGPSLNGTSLKEQPRGIKGDTSAAQQVSQSFQSSLGMPAISNAAQRIKGFFK